MYLIKNLDKKHSFFMINFGLYFEMNEVTSYASVN
jgi:hypothetical protein